METAGPSPLMQVAGALPTTRDPSGVAFDDPANGSAFTDLPEDVSEALERYAFWLQAQGQDKVTTPPVRLYLLFEYLGTLNPLELDPWMDAVTEIHADRNLPNPVDNPIVQEWVRSARSHRDTY